MSPIDNETWVIETGDTIIAKMASNGLGILTPWERLVYCLWVADYGMRNAGDLDTAVNVNAEFQSEGRRMAEELSLPRTLEAFAMTQSMLEREYFGRFELICDEIRNARQNVA
jgi:hypothetical protein